MVEQIDRRLLGTHEQEHLSSGQLVKAMILNGLGFVSAPLYLFQEFFEGKVTEHLIAPGVKPEHLNDDKLGRVLDKEYGQEDHLLYGAGRSTERKARKTRNNLRNVG